MSEIWTSNFEDVSSSSLCHTFFAIDFVSFSQSIVDNLFGLLKNNRNFDGFFLFFCFKTVYTSKENKGQLPSSSNFYSLLLLLSVLKRKMNFGRREKDASDFRCFYLENDVLEWRICLSAKKEDKIFLTNKKISVDEIYIDYKALFIPLKILFLLLHCCI